MKILSKLFLGFSMLVAPLAVIGARAASVMPVFGNDTVVNTLSFNDTFGHQVVIGTYSPITGLWAAAGGGVTSVGVSVPSWLTIAGSPITTMGTMAITGTSEPANLVLASPNGTSGAMTPRALTSPDLSTVCTNGQVFYNNAGAIGCLTAAGSGTVTSVSLTTPAWLTVTGSPITTTGTLAVTSTSEPQNQVLASPNGSTGAMVPRALVTADLSSTCPSGQEFFNNAGAINCEAPNLGTVTSVAMTVPAWLAVGGSPVTSSGTLALTTPNQSANFFLASPSGGSGALTPRAIVVADIATVLSSPGPIGNTVPGSGAFTTLSATGTSTLVAINSTGNVQITGGSLLNVDLQTSPPPNGSFLANAGAAYQNCPLIGCLSGAHQFSAVYFKNTAQFDATKAEYMTTFDSNLNSGLSPGWKQSTGYVVGNQVVANGNVYQETAASCTSLNTGTGPSGTGSGIADNTCLWNYLVSSFAAAKVGFFISSTTGSSSGYQSWGMSNDFVLGVGDTGSFKVGAEFDITNNSTDCAVGVKSCYNIFMTGNTQNPATAYVSMGTPAGNSLFAAHYAMIISGLKIADTADIEIDDAAPSAICISCLGVKAHTYVLQDLSTSTVGIALSGNYSGYAAIQTDGMTGTVAMTIKSGVLLCMNGTTDCFKWNSTSSAIDFSAQSVQLQQIANGSVATVLGSLGPVGSHTTVQEWFQIRDSAGTIRYVPGF